MSDTTTNGHADASSYWADNWPDAAGLPGAQAVSPIPPPPPPPPPPAQPTVAQVQPVQPAPVAQPQPVAQQVPPVMPAQRVMSAPPGYTVGAWPTHPPVEDEPDEDPPPAARTTRLPAATPSTSIEPVETKPSLFTPLGAWWRNSRKRSRTLTVLGVTVLGLLGGRYVIVQTAGAFGAAASKPMADAAADFHAATANGVQTGRTNTVVIPTDWFPCDLTPLASTAVGYDASNGSKTLDPVRAAEVARQVRVALSAGARIPDLYISTPAATSIIVTATSVPDGTPLFNCSGTQVPAKQDGTTATSAPGGATTATSAPR